MNSLDIAVNEDVLDKYRIQLHDLVIRFSEIYFWINIEFNKISDDIFAIKDYVFDIKNIITALENNIKEDILFNWYSELEDMEDAENWLTLYQYINKEEIEKDKKIREINRKKILSNINKTDIYINLSDI